MLQIAFLILTTLISEKAYSSEAQIKVIYGSDDRVHSTEARRGKFRRLAKATAAQIDTRKLTVDNMLTNIIGNTLEKSMGLCSDERFAKTFATSRCSGFLVGPDLLVTAGHCILNKSDCSKYSWVFGFNNNSVQSDTLAVVGNEQVFKCKKIIERSLTASVIQGGTGDDYALIQLDRKVRGVRPLKFRKIGKVPRRARLVVIGHPSGLPTIVSDNARIRDNNLSKYFVANLDTFSGNSGSAVFNVKTGVVEGILVRGEQDYRSDGNCVRVFPCSNKRCRGEDVVRITNIKALR